MCTHTRTPQHRRPPRVWCGRREARANGAKYIYTRTTQAQRTATHTHTHSASACSCTHGSSRFFTLFSIFGAYEPAALPFRQRCYYWLDTFLPRIVFLSFHIIILQFFFSVVVLSTWLTSSNGVHWIELERVVHGVFRVRIVCHFFACSANFPHIQLLRSERAGFVIAFANFRYSVFQFCFPFALSDSIGHRISDLPSLLNRLNLIDEIFL